MTKISPIDFKPELVSMMKSVLENASAYIDNASGKPATSATKAGRPGASSNRRRRYPGGKLHSVAIDGRSLPGGSRPFQKLDAPRS